MTATQRKRRTSDVPDEQERILLDTAEAELLAHGLAGMNVQRIAAAAGISRRTFYRRFPSKNDLLGALLARTLRRIFKQLAAATVDLSPRETVIESFALSARLAQSNPLFPYLVNGAPPETASAMHTVIERHRESATTAIATTLREAGAQMPTPDLLVVSEMMLRLAISFQVSPSPQVVFTDPEQVAWFASTMIAPLVW